MSSLLEAFILLLVIMDPIVSMTAYLALTKGKSLADKKRIATKAVVVAAAVFFIFALGGDVVLRVLGLDLDTFRVAGGIILVILGVQMALGLSSRKEHQDTGEAAVIIGTPLIAGPATITTSMLMVKEIGMLTTVVAGTGALAVTAAFLFLSGRLSRYVGMGSIRVLSTMMGIVTIGWGVSFILKGVVAALAAV
jgi:multiple antibiotic resistance protein